MKWALLLLVACSSAPVEEVKIEPTKDAITKTTENGPVKAVVRVWPAKPTLADPIYARVELTAAAGATVTAPYQEAGDQTLGRFRVVAFTRDQQRNSDGSSTQTQTYTLEPPTSGRHRLPPMRFEMTDAKGTQEVLTDEVPIEVGAIKTEVTGAALASALGELDPDVGGTPWLELLLGVSAVAVLGAGGTLIWRNARARKRIAAQRSAYDEAIARLSALGSPDKETADTWFVELSAIVRDYLEQRYDIRAPELTTEEFLLVATARPELSAKHGQLLVEFLERCDRVKFAGYRPDGEESLATLAVAKGFVEDTRLKEAA